MDVRVQYATTADGVRIAFSTIGRGRHLLYMPPLPLRHVELEWQLPEDRRWIERLAHGRTVIRYDPRGLGLSERATDDCGLDALVGDVAAVVDAAGVAEVALFACVNAGPIGIAYAARHPERVSHLVLWCAVARMADALPPQIVTLLDVAEKDWELFTEAAAHVMVGWTAGEAAHRYADYLRACVTPAFARVLLEQLRDVDVHELLSALRAPTLVLHRRGVESVPVARATELAAHIAGARLVILEGDLMRPGVGDLESAARAVDDFLGHASDVQPDGARTTATDSADAASAANVFRRDGEYWTLVFAGRVCRLRDAKGLHHIARLLQEPGSHVAAAELMSTPADALGDAGAALDATAKAAYKGRVAELRAELDDAERCHDTERATRARAELDFVARELAAAVGLGGRDRRASSAAERARLTVTKRIKDALARIRASHPALARHLETTIKTGQLCAYGIDPAQRVPWAVAG